jgi:integrase
MKYTMGFGPAKFKGFFLEFDRFCIERGIMDVHITREQIAIWHATCLNNSKSTIYGKYSILRRFCLYLCHLGQDCFVPKLPKPVQSDFVPYIFTGEQVEHFFEVCDGFTISKESNMSCILFTLPVLFRFLYSTGVRISEALFIKNEDVDFVHRQIVIRKTKNKMQRLIPVNNSLFTVLGQYEKYKNRMPLRGLSDSKNFFFISPAGKPLLKCNVLQWYKRILKKCEIPNSHAIRLHDIRHTCAVHSLVKLVGNGIDIYCALPLLSVFLGHKQISSTEKYVRLTQELYPEIIKMEQSVTACIFPNTTELKKEMNHGND